MTEGTGAEHPDQASSLRQILDDMAGDLEGVDVGSASGDGREYARRGVVFASCAGTAPSETAEFRLRPEIVDAATKTPGATASRRGPDWVSLRVASLDTFAVDRARAWFEAAWRIAGESPEPRPRRTH